MGILWEMLVWNFDHKVEIRFETWKFDKNAVLTLLKQNF